MLLALQDQIEVGGFIISFIIFNKYLEAKIERGKGLESLQIVDASSRFKGNPKNLFPEANFKSKKDTALNFR